MDKFDDKWWSHKETETVDVKMEVDDSGKLICDTFHIVQNCLGRFGYAGDIPLQLGELNEETEEGTYNFPTFKTPIEAFMYAKWCGFISSTYLAVSGSLKFYMVACVCRDNLTRQLYLPFLEPKRSGRVERLDDQTVEEYKALDLGEMVFWGVYETGMDSTAIWMADFAKEEEAEEACSEMFKRLSN